MDALMMVALALPFLGHWRKQASFVAFVIALASAAQAGNIITSFFFTLSLLVFVLSDWKEVKYPLFFLAMFDLIGLLSSTNFLELFIYFELAIYASYFLIIDQDFRAVIRYFVVCSIGSAFMLLAVALTYLQTGSLSTMNQGPLAFFVLGLLIKLGIAPFQDWLVEIYRNTSLALRVFFASVLTEISSLALLLMVTQASPALQAFALAAMLIANVMALTENSLLRLLALFDASNLAYDLLAVAVASESSRIAALYMMFSHALAMALVFIVIEASGSTKLSNLKAPRGLEIPFYAAFFILSGLPPFHLFPSKLLLFSSVFSASPASYLLLLNMVLGAVASLRIFAAIKGSRSVSVAPPAKFALFGLFVLSLVLGIWPQGFIRVVESQMHFLTR